VIVSPAALPPRREAAGVGALDDYRLARSLTDGADSTGDLPRRPRIVVRRDDQVLVGMQPRNKGRVAVARRGVVPELGLFKEMRDLYVASNVRQVHGDGLMARDR